MRGQAVAHASIGMRLQRGMAQLPELTVSDSSEAMLSGRKPPFRLLVRAVHDEGRRLSIRHAVSEGFVVRVLPFMFRIYSCIGVLPRPAGKRDVTEHLLRPYTVG